MQMGTFAKDFSAPARRNAELVAGATVAVVFVVLFGLAAATAALDVARLISTVTGITPA